MFVNMNFVWQRCYTRKRLPRKSFSLKIFTFRQRIKTEIAKKQYQKLDDAHEFDKIVKKNPTL